MVLIGCYEDDLTLKNSDVGGVYNTIDGQMMVDTLVLLTTVVCNMLLGMEVVQKIFLEKVLMHGMVVHNLVLV
ncbi:hypothetical protein J1N35_022093 [Gossypium stocksii]|uniref:Uncharacterized protein n=1 Tax=Gossypium stocksii TaxID=47602 RepID=A0A9D3VHI6_9ROSI|nr:hypothetical protein J1N35_022093 [Gossypium stocksii]